MKPISYFIYVLLLLTPNSLIQAQGNKRLIDSLLSTIPASEKDSNRVRAIYHKSLVYKDNSPDIAMELIHMVYDQSVAIEYTHGIADAYNMYGSLYFKSGKYDSSLFYHSKALALFTKINNIKGVVSCYNNIALAYSDLGKYDEAILSLVQGLKVVELSNQESLGARINCNLGKLYIELGLFEEAEKFINRGLELTKRYNVQGVLQYIYGMFGYIAIERMDTINAKAYYNLCYNECIKNNDKVLLSEVYVSLGSIYGLENHFVKAVEHYNKGLEIADELNVSNLKVNALNDLSYLYYKNNNYEKAQDYADKAHLLSKKIGYKIGLKYSASYLSSINYSLGHYKNAYNYLMYSDTIFDDDNKMVYTLSDLLTRIKNDQVQINLQEKKVRILILSLIVFFLITMIIGIVLFYRRRISKSKMKEHILSRELTSKAMFLAKRNEVFTKIEATLNENKSRFTQENQPIIQEIISGIQSAQDQQIWKEFEYYFTSVHKDFYTNLYSRFPSLTVNERRL